MKNQSFTTTLHFSKTPAEVYQAINNVRGWWSEYIDGPTDKQGQSFDYAYKDLHTCTIKVLELVEDKKVVWEVTANNFTFIKDPAEWTGTQMVFEILPKESGTDLRFTHVGLVHDHECYEVCEKAWTFFTDESLRKLVETGTGDPIQIEAVASSAKLGGHVQTA